MMSRNIFFLSYLYFIQGLPYGFQSRFLPVYFRSHGMSLTDISLFKLLLTPWMCKALWAPLVDRYGTKRSWLLWSMLGLVVTCFFGSMTPPEYLLQLAGVLFMFNLLTSTQDIAVDGIAVQVLSTSELAYGNIAQVVGYKCGAIFGGGVLTWMSEYLEWMVLFFSLSSVYLFSIYFVHVLIPKTYTTSIEISVPETLDFKDGKQYNSETQSVSHEDLQTIDPSYEKEDLQTSGPNYEKEDLQTSYSSYEKDRDKTERERLMVENQNWFIGHLKLVFNSPNTAWLMAFVLVYKLGEQGALSMTPLFLIDKNIPASQVGFWTGMVGQVVSIGGSVLGGWLISNQGFTTYRVLQLTCTLRILPLIFQVSTVWLWSYNISTTLYMGSVLSMCCMLLISGIVTTATFTMMMQCSQMAPQTIQATHYTTVATLEVLGKLTFSVLIGSFTDIIGYKYSFLLFVILTSLVLPILNKCPKDFDRVCHNKNH